MLEVDMKVLIYTDVHFCSYSSILRKRGYRYSERLENCILSVNWAEKLASDNGCDIIICLGDFFDKADLNSEELTAISTSIQWANLPHYFLVGNHEAGLNSLEHNSASIFNFNHLTNGNLFEVIDKPSIYNFGITDFVFIPYINELDRRPFSDYLHMENNNRKIVFSHNDIAGIQYGAFKSENGFNLEDISKYSSIFINGHLHNGEILQNKYPESCKAVINLGNLTGQNFSEDAFKYKHNALILDTDTLDFNFVENPYSYKFFKLDLTSKDIKCIDSLPFSSVISLKCYDRDVETIKDHLKQNKNIAESRIVIEPTLVEITENQPEITMQDHIQQFRDYILTVLPNDEILNQELLEICK